MVIKPQALHIPWSMLLFHRPEQVSYRRLCLGYLILINRVNLMLFILKQHFLLIVLPSNRQVLQSSNVRPSETTHFFVPLQCFSFTPLSIFLYAYIFALKATNSVMIFFSPLMYNHTTSSQLYYKQLQNLQRLHAKYAQSTKTTELNLRNTARKTLDKNAMLALSHKPNTFVC